MFTVHLDSPIVEANVCVADRPGLTVGLSASSSQAKSSVCYGPSISFLWKKKLCDLLRHRTHICTEHGCKIVTAYHDCIYLIPRCFIWECVNER